MLGIFIGIAAVVSLISLAQGLETAVTSQFQALGANTLSVQAASLGFGPPGTSVANPLTKSDLEVVKRSQGVDEALGRIITTSLTTRYRGVSTTIPVASYPEDANEVRVLNEIVGYTIDEGRSLRPGERNSIVIGRSLVSRQSFDRDLRIRDRLEIEGQEFTIVGILERQGSFQVDGTILMNEQNLRDLTGNEETYSIIQAQVVNVDNIDQVRENIQRDLRRHRGVSEGREDFTVETSEQTLEAITTILAAIGFVFIGIAAISLLVGGIGIMNTMYTSVLERTKEIGTMKATGAKNSDIFKLFLTESGLLGFAGGVIGVLLGILLAKSVEILGGLAFGTNLIQANISISLIVGALIFSFVIGSLAGTLPAYNASKLNPVDALRK